MLPEIYNLLLFIFLISNSRSVSHFGMQQEYKDTYQTISYLVQLWPQILMAKYFGTVLLLLFYPFYPCKCTCTVTIASWLLVHCSSLLRRGRYASYWNAFVLYVTYFQNIHLKYISGMWSRNSSHFHERINFNLKSPYQPFRLKVPIHLQSLDGCFISHVTATTTLLTI